MEKEGLLYWKTEDFEGRCPFCDCAEFLEGPHGGNSINIKCARCGAEFNEMGLFGVQLLGWPDKKSPLELRIMAERNAG